VVVARTDQGGGEQPRIVGACGRIVGVQLNEPATCLSASRMSGRNGSTPRPIRASASRRWCAGQVSSLVRQDRIQLAGIERLHRTGGQDHCGMPAGHAVGGRLGMLDQHGPQGGLGTADQSRGSAHAAAPAARRCGGKSSR